MTTLSASPFIVDSIWHKTRTSALAQISALTAITVLSAQVIIPLPFTPVPLTMQTFAILFGAAAIGPFKSLIAQFAYLSLAALGLPVLAGDRGGIEAIFGATAGYLFAFLLASFVVGKLASRITTKRFQGVLLGYLVGSLIIYAMGATWLAIYTEKGFYYALLNGVVPFLIGDAIKACLAASLLPISWRLINK
ncbi:MAG: biotin transporter BioY [Candidatus Nanopelagicales bacterium]|jgi:biotin transport system substrate-specific component|nr:biotin transporter BioY [Candidatus Nanopelagicales bacterium]